MRKSRIGRWCAPSPCVSRSVQAPRRIGATSAASAIFGGGLPATNTALRFFLSRFSARVTKPIMRSYASRASPPNVKIPCLSRISPSTFLFSSNYLGGFFGEPEARHQIRHEAEPAAECFRAQFGRVRLVDQAEHGGCVRVVDKFRRHEGVQQYLDRRRGRLRVDQISALCLRHLAVGKCLARAQGAQRFEPHRRIPGRLDRTHVPA